MEALCRPALQPFLDSITTFEDARYIIIGAPMDLTSSFRSGSRFAPDAIRQASQYMETHSHRTGLDLDDISLCDAGNIVDLMEVSSSLQRIEEAVSLNRASGKVPVLLGGEHAITLGALRALRPDLVVDFDAHLDLRDRLLGLDMSHGTFMRRAMEELDFRLVVVGGRALSREELDFANENADKVMMIAAEDFMHEGVEAAIESMEPWLDSSASAYLSVDMDVIDPASAPAVGNPSPEGVSVTQTLDLIREIAGERIMGFDLTEVAPHYDSGLTAVQAAHIVLETIYCLESGLRRTS
ncbi:MAG: agmatinase [Candidatus Bathyarchaeota archaeon]|nr:agmatinase [Candidatus Bathyarchaeota archaeon]